MLRAPLLLALAPEPACGARDGDGAGLTPPTAGQIAGIPVTGVARSRFHTATHPVPVVRGSPVRPLFVTAAGMPAADAADPVWHMAGRYRPPDALRRAGTSRTQIRPPP